MFFINTAINRGVSEIINILYPKKVPSVAGIWARAKTKTYFENIFYFAMLPMRVVAYDLYKHFSLFPFFL